MYTPLVNKEKNVMCMHWDSTSEYQHPDARPLFNQGLLDYFFNKEVFYISKFQGHSYAPEVYEIDYKEKKVFIEWSGETCNDIVYDSSRSLDKECTSWHSQLNDAIESIYRNNVYKVSLYPHCFFIKDGNLKTFDWYGCFDVNNCFVDYEVLEGMMGKHSSHRFSEASKDGIVDFSYFYKKSLQQHIKWPNDPLPALYNKLFGNE